MLRFYRNTSDKRFWYKTLPIFGRGNYGKRIICLWIGPIFAQWIPK